MPSTIKATKGDPGANSYATLMEMDAFADDLFDEAEWAALDDDDKTRFLLMATKAIDRLSIKYDKNATTQALKFPVSASIADWDGFLEARQACMTQALFLSHQIDSIREAQLSAVQGIKTETLGPTSKTVTGINSSAMYDPSVYQILRAYIAQGIAIQRG